MIESEELEKALAVAQTESQTFWNAPRCKICNQPEASYRHNTDSSPFAHRYEPKEKQVNMKTLTDMTASELLDEFSLLIHKLTVTPDAPEMAARRFALHGELLRRLAEKGMAG